MTQEFGVNILQDILNRPSKHSHNLKQKDYSKSTKHLLPPSLQCSQVVGYRSLSQKCIEQDRINCIKYDHTGKMLALGDQAGRVILFSSDGQSNQNQQMNHHYQFQSHKPGLDLLTQKPISQQIISVDWMRPQEKYIRLLTANSQTVKLWKIFKKSQKRVVRGSTEMLEMPDLEDEEPRLHASLKASYHNISYSPLHSIDLANNQEHLLTANDNSIFMWNLEQTNRPLVLHQISNNQSAKEIKLQKISCAKLHPDRESLFAFGTTLGNLKVIDIRQSINKCNSILFHSEKNTTSFLSYLGQQISSLVFLPEFRMIAVRDLVSVKIWDMAAPKLPLLDLNLNQNSNENLCDIFEAQVFHDIFNIKATKSGTILTGNYGDSFHQIDVKTGRNVQYELDFQGKTRKRQVGCQKRWGKFSCNDKVLNLDVNKTSGQVAASSHSCFIVYSET